MMKELQEFAQLSAWQPDEGAQRRLYDMAMTGLSREEAKAAFELSESHFNSLYKKLKERMTRGVLDSPLKGFNHIQRLQFDVRRQYETAMVTVQTGHKAAGVPLARATMRKAEKLGMYQVAMDLCRELLRHYSTVEVNKERHEQYFERLWSFWREVQNELQAECLFFQFAFRLKKDILTNGVEEQLAELAKISSKSYRFHYMRLYTEMIFYQAAGREEEMMKTCKDALEFFSQYKDLPYVVKFSFVHRLAPYHLSRREYAQAKKIIDESMVQPAYGRHNWQIIKLYQILYGLHTANLPPALGSYEEVVRVPKKYRNKEMVMRWKLIRAFLMLADLKDDKAGGIDSILQDFTENGVVPKKFNLTLVELLHQLKIGEQENFIIGIHLLEKQIAADGQHKRQARFQQFLLLLKCIQESGFNAKKAKQLGAWHLEQLKNSPTHISIDLEMCEVIPFEKIWIMILDWLPN